LGIIWHYEFNNVYINKLSLNKFSDFNLRERGEGGGRKRERKRERERDYIYIIYLFNINYFLG